MLTQPFLISYFIFYHNIPFHLHFFYLLLSFSSLVARKPKFTWWKKDYRYTFQFHNILWKCLHSKYGKYGDATLSTPGPWSSCAADPKYTSMPKFIEFYSKLHILAAFCGHRDSSEYAVFSQSSRWQLTPTLAICRMRNKNQ